MLEIGPGGDLLLSRGERQHRVNVQHAAPLHLPRPREHPWPAQTSSDGLRVNPPMQSTKPFRSGEIPVSGRLAIHATSDQARMPVLA